MRTRTWRFTDRFKALLAGLATAAVLILGAAADLQGWFAC